MEGNKEMFSRIGWGEGGYVWGKLAPLRHQEHVKRVSSCNKGAGTC